MTAAERPLAAPSRGDNGIGMKGNGKLIGRVLAEATDPSVSLSLVEDDPCVAMNGCKAS